MRKANIIIVLVSALVLIGVVVGCYWVMPIFGTMPATAAVETGKNGLLYNVSGPVFFCDIAYIEGEKAAIQIYNDSGGIKGLGVAEVVIAEGGGDGTPAIGTSNLECLISSEKVVAISELNSAGRLPVCIPLLDLYAIHPLTIMADELKCQKVY